MAVLTMSLSNIRITTFFAGESEVKIVDPRRISSVQPVGCKVEFVSPRGDQKVMSPAISC